jgi:formate-dependent phosphoribosylglycinamide formyltransferase (GAR transformylase)
MKILLLGHSGELGIYNRCTTHRQIVIAVGQLRKCPAMQVAHDLKSSICDFYVEGKKRQ